MQAKKISVCVTVEALSIDSVPALLVEVAEHLGDESVNGTINKADGDMVTWNKSEVDVIF